jgi:ATP-dependent RNA helicase RhlE
LTFSDFNLDSRIIESMDSMNFTKPTAVQETAIPVILNKQDLIACAQTGTGKTAAFLLPAMHHILQKSEHTNSVKTLIIVPTRELALQIDQSLQGMAYFTDVSSLAIYGGSDGSDFDLQKKALSQGVDIIIATPGKLISHLNLGYVKLDGLLHFILDEADRMLDMGFFEDIIRISSFLPKERQTLMFSATMPSKIRMLAKKILNDPFEINVAISKPAEGLVQEAYSLFDHQKIKMVQKIISGKDLSGVIIFSSTKRNVKSIHAALEHIGIKTAAIHSDLEQKEREEVMLQFKNKKIPVLVATDIVSRGIDVKELSMVINFDVPSEPEDYVHRIGRTARAEENGIAITFINQEDQQKFARIEKMIGSEINKISSPEEFGETPIYAPLLKTGNRNKNFRKFRHSKN